MRSKLPISRREFRHKKQGALKKTSGRSYSLERPVARHFV